MIILQRNVATRTLALVGAVCSAALSTASMAQNAPVLVAVGNGPPVQGSSSSPVGVGVLTPQPNGTPNSVRVLGADKTAGVSTTALNGHNGNGPTEVQIHTAADGVPNGALAK